MIVLLRILVKYRISLLVILWMIVLGILTYLVVFPVIYKIYSYTLAPLVPSGDDPAAHIYIALKVVMDPGTVIRERIFNSSVISFQYPNIIHIMMALIYIFTHDITTLVSFMKAYSFFVLILGLILYSSLIFYLLGNQYSLFEKLSASFLYVVLACLLSRGITWTLCDGSVMELTAVLILLPLTLLALYKEYYVISGVLLGLASLNIIGFIELCFITTPWIVSLLIEKKIKSFAKILAGVLIGGNIFLIRLLHKMLIRALPKMFTYAKSANSTLTNMSIDTLSQISYMYGSMTLFYVFLLTYGVSLLLSMSLRQYYSNRKKYVRLHILASTWIFHLLLIMLMKYNPLDIAEVVIPRLIRVNLFISTFLDT